MLAALASDAVGEDWRIIIAIVLTMIWNFIFDRWLAFWYARHQAIWRQLLGFLAVCTVPVIVNFFVTRWLLDDQVVTPAAGAIGALVASAVGVLFNWLVARSLVFRRPQAG
jgi:putative flippase GtrA